MDIILKDYGKVSDYEDGICFILGVDKNVTATFIGIKVTDYVTDIAPKSYILDLEGNSLYSDIDNYPIVSIIDFDLIQKGI